MPEPGELLSAFDKDCNDLHLSQEYIQDLLAAKVSDDRVAIIIPPPARSPKEIQALAAVMAAATKRRWRQYRRDGETKRLTDSEYVAQETLLADIQLYAARRVEELAKRYVRTGPDGSKNDLALFTDECESLVLELWKERRDAFDPPLPYAMYEFSLLNESRYVALLPGGRSLESKLRLPFGFPTLQERIDWHIRRFSATMMNGEHSESSDNPRNHITEDLKTKRGRPARTIEDEADAKQIGINLKKLQNGLQYQMIADQVHCSASTVAKDFQGRGAPWPRVDKYAPALGFTVEDILQGTNGPKATRIKNTRKIATKITQ